MSDIDVAIIGTGPHPDETREEKGFSMGYRHADAYEEAEGCSVVGCADLMIEYARTFTAEYGLSEDAAFDDHEAMLTELEPDLVSVCTPPKTHLPIVSDCVTAASVGGVHCEKPMAPTWGESKELVERCANAGVQLTFNFQNRGRPAVSAVERLLESGEIGDLRRVEVSRADLMQTGIHNIDLANRFNGDRDVAWVLGQADTREESVWYTDMYSEDQGLGLWAYENGVHGVAFAGEHADELLDCHVRLLGSEGAIELRFWGDPELEVRRARDEGWEAVDVGEGDAQTAAVQDVVDALREGRPSMLRAENALRATELVFAIWESSKRRGRVDLPLANEGNALDDVVDGT